MPFSAKTPTSFYLRSKDEAKGELTEPGIEELDRVDGVGAGAVEDLLAAGGDAAKGDAAGGRS